MLTTATRANNRPRNALIKLKNLPIFAGYKSIVDGELIHANNALKKRWAGVFDWLEGAIETFLPQLNNTPQADYFKRSLQARFGDWYVPIKLYSINANNTIVNSAGGSGSLLDLNYRTDFFLLKGNPVLNSEFGKMFKIERVEFKGNMPQLTEIYYYNDSIEIVRDIAQTVANGLEQVAKLYNAYSAIPTANEQFTDETTITPNLTTTSKTNFNPINTISQNISDKSTVTQGGNQKSVTKRATNRTAREQADVVRNIPNLFTQTMSEVAALLISPQAVQDMLDWGQCDYDYIDYE